MKIPLAAAVASLCLACVKQPPPVNAPTVIEIPPMPPQPPPTSVVSVRARPPRPEFHYAFRLDRADEWSVQQETDWVALLGERPDLVLRNAQRGILVSFQSAREESGAAEVVAQRIVAEDFTADGTEPEEIGGCNVANGSECSRFGWLARDANANLVRQGVVFVMRFAHVERYVFAMYAEWDVSPGAWYPVSDVDNLAWSLAVVPKTSSKEK